MTNSINYDQVQAKIAQLNILGWNIVPGIDMPTWNFGIDPFTKHGLTIARLFDGQWYFAYKGQQITAEQFLSVNHVQPVA